MKIFHQIKDKSKPKKGKKKNQLGSLPENKTDKKDKQPIIQEQDNNHYEQQNQQNIENNPLPQVEDNPLIAIPGDKVVINPYVSNIPQNNVVEPYTSNIPQGEVIDPHSSTINFGNIMSSSQLIANSNPNQQNPQNNNIAMTVKLSEEAKCEQMTKTIKQQLPSVIDNIIDNIGDLQPTNLMGTQQLSQIINPMIDNKKELIPPSKTTYLNISLFPKSTSDEYSNFKSFINNEETYLKYKNIINTYPYFYGQLMSNTICIFTEVDNLYKYYSQIIKTSKGISCNQLKNYTNYWRKIGIDGNCYYRAIMFRYLEILIINKQIDILKDLTIDMFKAFKGELSSMIQINQNLEIDRLLVFTLLKIIIEELETNGEAFAYRTLLKSINGCQSFDYSLVLYFRYILKRYIQENEDKAYSKDFDIQIGNFLPIEFKTNEGKFLFDDFYERYLMKMYEKEQKISIYLTPFVLGIPIDVLLYEDPDNPIKRIQLPNDTNLLNVNDPRMEFLNTQKISLFQIQNCCDLIYTNEQFNSVMKFAENVIVYYTPKSTSEVNQQEKVTNENKSQQKLEDIIKMLIECSINEYNKIRNKVEQGIKINPEEEIETLQYQLNEQKKKIELKYLISRSNLETIYKQYSKKLCALCKVQITIQNRSTYISLPCGCNLCSQNCLNLYYNNFFKSILRCSCFVKYNPVYLEELKIILQNNSHPDSESINNIIKLFYDNYCCCCFKRKLTVLQERKCEYYGDNVQEFINKYLLVPKEINNHKFCDECANRVNILKVFHCLSCNNLHKLVDKY